MTLLLLCLFQYTGLIAAGLGMAAVGFVGEYLSQQCIHYGNLYKFEVT